MVMKKYDALLEIQTYFKNPIDDYKLIDIKLKNKLYYMLQHILFIHIFAGN